MNTHLGLIGKKLGCTQIFDANGNVARVTVVEAGPCIVVRKRSEEKDGYVALQLGFGERREKLTKKPLVGYFEKNNVAAKTVKSRKGHDVKVYPRTLKEIRLSIEDAAKFEVGQALTVQDLFTEGQLVDVTGTSKGRGFSGVFRRHHFAGMVSTHGTHEYRRHGGSIGTNMTPGRTLPGIKMPGQHGNKRATVQNLRIAKIVADQNLVLIEGSVPGSDEAVVTVRGAVKAKKKKA
ncbi:MAG: 50S ribosomal protein L3 [Myxococcales bacterium]|nr:50S ribosomal protein L3 [Myxococcales bacterium]